MALALKENSVDLTALAREGKLDPVIGRDEVIRRTIQILSRRTKNNPILIGGAGVGKTAILEGEPMVCDIYRTEAETQVYSKGLAQRLIADEVPESLKGLRLVSLDLARLMSGTGIRGSFEEKMKKLIDDIEKDKDIVSCPQSFVLSIPLNVNN